MENPLCMKNPLCILDNDHDGMCQSTMNKVDEAFPPPVDVAGLAKKLYHAQYTGRSGDEVSALKKMELIQNAMEQGWMVKVVPYIIQNGYHEGESRYSIEISRPVDMVDLCRQRGPRVNLIMSFWIDDTDFFTVSPIV